MFPAGVAVIYLEERFRWDEKEGMEAISDWFKERPTRKLFEFCHDIVEEKGPESVEYEATDAARVQEKISEEEL